MIRRGATIEGGVSGANEMGRRSRREAARGHSKNIAVTVTLTVAGAGDQAGTIAVVASSVTSSGMAAVRRRARRGWELRQVEAKEVQHELLRQRRWR